MQQQQQQQRGQITNAQLQQILRTNQLPDGRELTAQMRNALIQRIQGQQRQALPKGACFAAFCDIVMFVPACAEVLAKDTTF